MGFVNYSEGQKKWKIHMSLESQKLGTKRNFNEHEFENFNVLGETMKTL